MNQHRTLRGDLRALRATLAPFAGFAALTIYGIGIVTLFATLSNL